MVSPYPAYKKGAREGTCGDTAVASRHVSAEASGLQAAHKHASFPDDGAKAEGWRLLARRRGLGSQGKWRQAEPPRKLRKLTPDLPTPSSQPRGSDSGMELCAACCQHRDKKQGGPCQKVPVPTAEPSST